MQTGQLRNHFIVQSGHEVVLMLVGGKVFKWQNGQHHPAASGTQPDFPPAPQPNRHDGKQSHHCQPDPNPPARSGRLDFDVLVNGFGLGRRVPTHRLVSVAQEPLSRQARTWLPEPETGIPVVAEFR